MTDVELNTIRKKVEGSVYVNMENSEQNEQFENVETEYEIPVNQDDTPTDKIQDEQENKEYEMLKEDIQRKWEEVKHQDIKDRDPLSKINKSKKVKQLIRLGNKVIADIKESCN